MASASDQDTGYLGKPKPKVDHEVVLIEGKYHRIKNVTVHQFTMGDVDDPQLYAAEPLLNWQNSESGNGSWNMLWKLLCGTKLEIIIFGGHDSQLQQS